MEKIQNPFTEAIAEAFFELKQRDYIEEDNKIQLDGGEEHIRALQIFNPSDNEWEASYGVAEATLSFFDKLDGKKGGRIDLSKTEAKLFRQSARQLLNQYKSELNINLKEVKDFEEAGELEVYEEEQKNRFQEMKAKLENTKKTVSILIAMEKNKKLSLQELTNCSAYSDTDPNQVNEIACIAVYEQKTPSGFQEGSSSIYNLLLRSLEEALGLKIVN